MDEKKVLIEFDTLKIIRFDESNVEVQTAKILPAGEFKLPGKSGETFIRETPVKSWETWGYYPCLNVALEQVFRQGLLITDEKRTLGEYLKEFEKIAERIKDCTGKQS